jgi:hypothetical protein
VAPSNHQSSGSVPTHIQNQQFLPNTINYICKSQPTTDNPMPLSSHHNQLNGIISTTLDKQGDIVEDTNTIAWQQVWGTKRRKINEVLQNNNPPESAIITNNSYDILANEIANEKET